jgi:hypothetical protein
VKLAEAESMIGLVENRMIAALYVETGGTYFNIPDVYPFDVERDARFYDGPYPVVAHPPCGPWGRLRHLSRKDDPLLAVRAVEQVRQFGGVLEHPRYSKLWEECRLPKPGEGEDAWGGWTFEVDQCRFGHPARKMTWLYMVRTAPVFVLPPPREPTHWASGSRESRRGPVPPGIKVCSAQQRRRTPLAFP